MRGEPRWEAAVILIARYLHRPVGQETTATACFVSWGACALEAVALAFGRWLYRAIGVPLGEGYPLQAIAVGIPGWNWYGLAAIATGCLVLNRRWFPWRARATEIVFIALVIGLGVLSVPIVFWPIIWPDP